MEFLLPKNNKHRMTSKELEKNEIKERKRNILYLMEGCMRDYGLFAAADALVLEAQLSNDYEICDNVDLDMILLDYSSYYHIRFDKYPRILRRIEQQNSSGVNTQSITPKKAGKTLSGRHMNKVSSASLPTPAPTNHPELHIGVTNLSGGKHENEVTSSLAAAAGCKVKDRDLDRPALCDFEGYSNEWREMADLVIREIVPKKGAACITWGDCVGLEEGVELLREAVIYPRSRPDLFEGLLTPWRGILLCGPPGTGKTLLARALAAESNATFINLTISTFVNKWRGESEKMLKVLFDVARLYSPTTIFIDELDSLVSRHADYQHEASQRFKSELLVQLDGLVHCADNDGVFVLATTNSPWNLCGAVLRRFEKRILVNVPDRAGRGALFRYYFDKHPANRFTAADYDAMAESSDTFSGADIKFVCREAAMCALRERLHGDNHVANEQNNHCNPNVKLRTLTMQDVRHALSKIRPTSDHAIISKYKEWIKMYGSS